MVDAITPQRLNLLKVVGKYPDLTREKLLSIPGITPPDLAYLVDNDLIREREPGHFRVSHLGQRVLAR